MPTTGTPGPIVRDEMLEARGRTAFPIDRSQTVRVVDVDGQQVADFVCFRRPDTLMTITADTCGRHDLLAGSCSEGTNRDFGALGEGRRARWSP